MTLGTKTVFSGAVKPSSIEQENYEADLFAQRTTEIPSNMEGRWEYDGSNNCVYAGYAPKGLSEDDDGWLVQKFTWVGSNCTKREINYSTWTSHTF